VMATLAELKTQYEQYEQYERWRGMARVNVIRWRMGEERVLLVPLGCRARDRLPVRCPVCGAEVGEVRRVSGGGRDDSRAYYTLHEDEGTLHLVGVKGSAGRT